MGACLTLAVACGSARPASPPPTSKHQPQAVEAEPEAMPPLDVLQRLRGGEDERTSCFESAGEVRDGFVKLGWRVKPDGRVEDVVILGSSVHDTHVETCIAQAVEKLDFGPRATKAKARWTFVHRLPRMPGVDEALAAREKQRKKKRKKKKQDTSSDDVPGVSIEAASPGNLELNRIEDIVHAGFPLFAYCYRAALDRDPALGGLVRLRFVIDEEGSVMGVMDSGSEFGDRTALDCMAEGIFALSFPPPAGGDVRVQYRIVFESG